ncbi:Spermatid-specific manchette-related protein 1 [Plecturocebus cupreus]
MAQGLTHTMERPVDPKALQKMAKCALQDYTYRGSISGHPYLPEKYWLSQEEADKCTTNYLSSDRYNTWRTEPYNSSCCNKYTTYLPRLPKEAGMETAVRGMTLECPSKPERLNANEREVVVNMLNSVSRNQQLPRIAPRCGCVDPLPSRLPFHGYESACSGRHYCLRGMDYYASGAPCTDRRLRPWCREQPTVRVAGFGPPQPGSTHTSPAPRPSPTSSPASSGLAPSLLYPRAASSRGPAVSRLRAPRPELTTEAGEPERRYVLPYEHRPGMQCAVTTPLPSYCPYPNLRWDTSHFKKTGGPQRNNYVIHPEFVSEAYPDYSCW